MLGVSGASATIRVMASALGKQALKKLPQKALTKTIYYPIVKSICKIFGVKMTKGIFAKGVSKAIPIVGGFISGTLTFASMRPMGRRLIDAFDEAKFDYSKDEFEDDWEEIQEFEPEKDETIDVEFEQVESPKASPIDVVATIREYKALLDEGAISEDEFAKLKASLMNITTS